MSMTKLMLALFLGVLLLVPLTSPAQTKSAGFLANCRSLTLNPSTGSDPTFGTVIDYFTTYDGTSGFPLHDDLGGGNYLFSGEARPRAGQPGVYEADFAIHSSTVNGWPAYGSLTLNLPTADADNDGMPDLTQLDQGVNAPVSGTISFDAPAPSSSAFSGTLTRTAGQRAGNYSLAVTNSSTLNGTWSVNALAGSITYSRTNGNVMTFSATNDTDTFTGSTSFTVNNANQITLPQFTLTRDDSQVFTVQAGTVFNRTGNTYVGNAVLFDGLPETSWPDYLNWVFKIADTNDADGNGIPDLSDALPAPPATNSPGCVPGPVGMVSWWTGDGTANDLQGTNHGMLQNGAAYAAGRVGQGFNLNGSNAFVQIPHSAGLSFSTQLTVVAWIEPAALGSDNRIVDKHTAGMGDGYVLDLVNGK